MKPKEPFNLFLPRPLVKEIRAAANVYGDRISLVMSAAAIQFLESHPKVQAEYIEKVLMSELKRQVEDMMTLVRAEQAKRVQDAEAVRQRKNAK